MAIGLVRAMNRRVRAVAVRAALLSVGVLALSAAPALAGWAGPKPIVPGVPFTAFSPVSVSCPTSHFCATIDFSGLASTWNGTSWSKPTQIDPQLSPPTSTLVAVSCGSASHCVAVDTLGNEITYSAGTWKAPVPIAPGVLFGVSCASSSFCVAVDQQAAIVFNGTTWSAPQPIPGASSLTSVSCPTASFCTAADSTENAFIYNGHTWSAPVPNRIQSALVSCPSASFCGAVGGNQALPPGRVFANTWNGTSWSSPVNVLQDILVIFDGISCPSATFCAATAWDDIGLSDFAPGETFLFNGSKWTASAGDQYTLADVSCASSSFCMAVDVRGRYMKWFVGTGASVTAARRSGSAGRSRARAAHRRARARHR